MSTDQRGSTMTNKHIGLAEQNRKGESEEDIVYFVPAYCRKRQLRHPFSDLLDQRKGYLSLQQEFMPRE